MSILLEVEHLRTEYTVRRGLFGRPRRVHAVTDVSFQVAAGETVGLVGESGCGKSTIARTLLGLEQPSAGVIHLAGRDVTRPAGEDLRFLRRGVQMVFQDPYGSLNPRLRIGSVLEEVLQVNTSLRPLARRARALELLERVGLGGEHATRFPHQLSGGQRQRVGIARALAVEPKLILADEPVSALDVSVQAQMINLFRDLQAQLGLAYLFIAHDLAVVEYISDRVLVMYLGRIVEAATAARLFGAPRHPYTRALLAAIPDPSPAGQRTPPKPLAGDVPSPLAPPPGCAFHPRCPQAQEICRHECPVLLAEAADPTHQTACFFAG